jgi:hypothetical protein
MADAGRERADEPDASARPIARALLRRSGELLTHRLAPGMLRPFQLRMMIDFDDVNASTGQCAR